ncbi:MAG: hypothetical protein ACOY4D_13795 [Pseudomonadota bacterium]
MRQDTLPAQPDTPSLRTLQAAIFYMMSHYSAHPCPCLARAIADHLRMFAGHPGNADCPMMRDICEKLSRYWRQEEEGARAASQGEPDSPVLVH